MSETFGQQFLRAAELKRLSKLHLVGKALHLEIALRDAIAAHNDAIRIAESWHKAHDEEADGLNKLKAVARDLANHLTQAVVSNYIDKENARIVIEKFRKLEGE